MAMTWLLRSSGQWYEMTDPFPESEPFDFEAGLEKLGFSRQPEASWYANKGGFRIDLYTVDPTQAPKVAQYLILLRTKTRWWALYADSLPHALDVIARWEPLTGG